ncbi:MAG: glycosyltransferase family 1 protein [Flavobacteriales bacterium]
MNTRLLIADRLDGIGWFTHEVMSRITRDCPEHQFLFLFDRAFDDEFVYEDNVWAKELFPQARHPLLYRMYFEYSVPKALKQWKADLFFSPDGFLSTRTRIPQIPVIHDINFEHRPQDLPRAYANYYRSNFPQFAKIAKRIVTVSEYSANDIARTYGVDRDKIQVAYNGSNVHYRKLTDSEKLSTLNEVSGGKPYFLFVGNFSYRKNIHGIVQAYDLYRKSGGYQKLLLVGNPLWHYKEMDDALANSNFADDIIFTGNLGIERLSRVMGSATALIFPSYFEGFGIPIVEAFNAETPVITGTSSSLPEVAGDAALIAEPDDHAKIAEHMKAIETDQKLADSLRKKGKARATQFSWDETARKVKEVLISF